MNSEQKGSSYAILSGFLYGFIGYFGVSAIHGNLSASTMLFWRFLIASLLIFLFVLPQIKGVKDTKKQMFLALSNGGVFYGLSTMLYFCACYYISSGLAMVIFFTYPVMIMLLNYFLYGQLIPAVYYMATAVILIGMLFLIDMSQMAFDLVGIGLGLASAFCYAGYIISSKRNQVSPNISTLMVCLGCMIISLVVSCATNTLALPSSSDVWINLLGIGVIATVIPIFLMLYSLQYISSEKASILSVLEPVFVVIFGVLLLGETLHAHQAVGIILVLAGALLTLFSHKINIHRLTYLIRAQ